MKKAFSLISLLIIMIGVPLTVTAGEKNKSSRNSLASPLVYEYKFLDGNRINCTMSSDGPFADYRRTGTSGLEWPIGSGKTAVFTGGIWLGGIHRPMQQIRMSVMDYRSEYQPGPLLETFNTTTNNDILPTSRAADPRYRLYKIDRADLSGTSGNPDFVEWPGDLGAPFEDKNNNGRWDPGIDLPRLYGDQQIWSVVNDASVSKHTPTSTSAPMGVEVQTLSFCYGNAGLLNNMMFLKWTVINKSDADYDSVFITMWSDTDLGDAADDRVACDTLLNLEYVYNGDNDDGTASGYGNRPPACGFDFFQGPRVAGSAADSAHFGGRWIKGFKNLPAASHVPYFNGNPQYSDPQLGSTNFPQMAYAYMNGINGTSHQPFIDPTTGKVSKYVFSGDPVTGTGWLMENSGLPPQDVRSMISAGPFTLAKGDTQEIVGGFVIGQGTDNINSVTALKKADVMAQHVFNRNFAAIPSLTAKTDIQVAGAMISLSCETKNPTSQSVNAAIRKYDGTILTQTALFDDGNHGDGIAGDKIFGTTVITSPQNQVLLVDISVNSLNAGTEDWPAMADITTTQLQFGQPTLLSDNLNEDGKANPGENVRFNIKLGNPYGFGFTNIALNASTPFSSKSILVPSLPANSEFTPSYEVNNYGSYLDFFLPSDYPGTEIRIRLTASDGAGNQWSDSVTVPVFSTARENAVVQRLRGHSSLRPSVVVTDKASLQNRIYVVFGVDSADTDNTAGYSVKDSLSGSIVLRNIPLTSSELLGHVTPPIDGFKVNWNGAYYADVSPGGRRYSTADSLNFPWMSYNSPSGSPFAPVGKRLGDIACGSSIHNGDYRDIQVRFSAKTGFTDVNNNGSYDIGEPYRFDTLNTSRSQRAYFYRKETAPSPYHYVGYLNVPLAVYDIESNPQRQLSLVVIDNDNNNQWDIDQFSSSTLRNYIYVLSDTYDSTGKTYDSTKGGIDLSVAVKNLLPLPCYWLLWIMHDGFHVPYGGAGEFNLYATRPWTSRDAFVFNPTISTGVTEGQTPASYALEQNYPNPFNPTTMIRYSLERPIHVSLIIYNVLGQRVRVLVNEEEGAGKHVVTWDGTNHFGEEVASGVYFYRLEAGNFTTSKKMMLLK